MDTIHLVSLLGGTPWYGYNPPGVTTWGAQFNQEICTTLNDDSSINNGHISEIQTVLERGAQELSRDI